ncbi:hypothetical protein UY3_07452 [Chelonia mydas]|uniref:Uncharacterized protein n=1 Tax=Chelonia mydas TaxID=8469 RepID=M7BTS1_CHEMY|nr:hypothetical protein UY3_07452 [Chelonia mydas]
MQENYEMVTSLPACMYGTDSCAAPICSWAVLQISGWCPSPEDKNALTPSESLDVTFPEGRNSKTFLLNPGFVLEMAHLDLGGENLLK